MARARLADVAREAGVSIGAASDALAGKNQIPEPTRQRVRDAAAKLGYVPNPVARAMRMGHLPLLGIVIGSLRRPGEYTPHRGYWGELIGVVTLAAADRGYGVVVLPGLADSQFDPSALAAMAVISSAPNDPDLDLALALGVPVLTDTPTDDPVAIVVDVPYTETVVAACDHLTERGARRPALLCSDLGTNFSIAVIAAYENWCATAGTSPVIIDSSCGDESLAATIDDVLDAGVDGVYSVDGRVPMLLEAAARRGAEIGSELLIVELDDDTDGACTARGITNVSIDLSAFLVHAVNTVIDVTTKVAKAPPGLRCGFRLSPRASTRGRG